MGFYIYSTLANDNTYCKHQFMEDKNALPVVLGQVTVKGGAGVSNKRLETPLGVLTIVSDEEMELLNENSEFKKHKDRGFIRVERRDHDIEKMVAGMTLRDNSAPIRPEDCTTDEIKPVLNKDKKAA